MTPVHGCRGDKYFARQCRGRIYPTGVGATFMTPVNVGVGFIRPEQEEEREEAKLWNWRVK
ncbi:MAG: hypothetical protein COS84_03190 [Armatimonadetes bacterium CG07_land_8_20_14_0_80_40_9]|nr:MAG: hypothetical protein COS84_03190 [Armatimonadetes bacterium CG07_land_8_20_14_0_80_40_9]